MIPLWQRSSQLINRRYLLVVIFLFGFAFLAGYWRGLSLVTSSGPSSRRERRRPPRIGIVVAVDTPGALDNYRLAQSTLRWVLIVAGQSLRYGDPSTVKVLR